MKKAFLCAATLCAAFVMSGCSSLGSKSSTSSIGGTLLSSALSGTTSSSSVASTAVSALTGSTSGTGVLGTLLSSLLSTKTTTKSIYGTWTYSSPKVAFESESVLAQIGSSVASSKIESTLGTQLTKIGFSAGKTSFTFNSDGSFTMSLSSKTYSGTYTYDSSAGTMTLKGAFGVASLTPYVSVSGSEMYMLFDADKLLSIVTKVGSVNSTLSSLLSKYDGLKLGWTLTK